MLSEIGWLVIVWIIWSAIFFITMALIRFTMRGQQETVGEQELEITAARTGQSLADLRAAASAAPTSATPAAASATTSAMRWLPRWPRRHEPPPPVSAS